MQFDLTRFSAVAISMASAISLVCGPSPSAARADYETRLAREEAARQAPVNTAPLASDRSGPSKSQDPSGERSSLASFVAPTAAKPADTDPPVSKAAAQASPMVVSHPVICPSQERPMRVVSRQLHRPAFQANAPPSR